jgi:catalase (peroxidase I)
LDNVQNSVLTNDEDVVIQRGDANLSDSFFVEFMRMWKHFEYRSRPPTIRDHDDKKTDSMAYLSKLKAERDAFEMSFTEEQGQIEQKPFVFESKLPSPKKPSEPKGVSSVDTTNAPKRDMESKPAKGAANVTATRKKEHGQAIRVNATTISIRFFGLTKQELGEKLAILKQSIPGQHLKFDDAMKRWLIQIVEEDVKEKTKVYLAQANLRIEDLVTQMLI